MYAFCTYVKVKCISTVLYNTMNICRFQKGIPTLFWKNRSFFRRLISNGTCIQVRNAQFGMCAVNVSTCSCSQLAILTP